MNRLENCHNLCVSSALRKFERNFLLDSEVYQVDKFIYLKGAGTNFDIFFFAKE